MQIQRVNMQQPVAKNKQNSAKGEPAFGIKFYADQQLAQNVLSDVDDYMGFAKDVKDSNLVQAFCNAIKKFMKDLPQHLAEHNANPANHQLFNNDINIVKIEVGYDHPKNGFLSLADSSGDKTPIKKNCRQILNHFEDFYNQSDYPVADLLEARIVTNTGVPISSGRLTEFKTKEGFKDLAGSLQKSEIIHLERTNPNLYWDMIKPPTTP